MDKKIFTLLNCICLCSYAVGLPRTGSLQSLTVENCGTSILPPRSPDRIVGGNIAPQGQYPWIVSLRLDGSFGHKHVCGATILNKNWVITAAHCIRHVDEPSRYQIVVGLHELFEEDAQPAQRIKISELVVHEKYDGWTFKNDIALLKTDKPIDIAGSKGYVNGICLPTRDKDPEGYATVIGWGHTRQGGVKSDTLREVILPIVSRDICQLSYDDAPLFDKLGDTQICAGVTGKDSCQYDSGGPLFQTNSKGVSTLIGIVSIGRGCGLENFPGIYTKVSSYQRWIENVMSKY